MAKKKTNGGRIARAELKNAIIMLLPAWIFLAVMIAYPLAKVVRDSFFFQNLVNKSVTGFSGLSNFQKVISDEHFLSSLRNTITWTVFSVLGEYLMGMVTALLLNKPFKGRAVFRTLIFIPWLVPIIVAGMTWNWMLNTEFGIINYLLVKLGIASKAVNFLGDSHYAMATVIFVNIWRSFPYYTISFLSALQAVPEDLEEAAAIDGAGMWSRLFKITLPQLRSVSLVIVFMHVIWTSINFDFIWILTGGGPNYSTQTLPIMIYKYSMQTFDVGAASSLSTMMFSVMLVLFLFYYQKRSRISQDML